MSFRFLLLQRTSKKGLEIRTWFWSQTDVQRTTVVNKIIYLYRFSLNTFVVTFGQPEYIFDGDDIFVFLIHFSEQISNQMESRAGQTTYLLR